MVLLICYFKIFVLQSYASISAIVFTAGGDFEERKDAERLWAFIHLYGQSSYSYWSGTIPENGFIYAAPGSFRNRRKWADENTFGDQGTSQTSSAGAQNEPNNAKRWMTIK